jgi:hypothetical protein
MDSISVLPDEALRPGLAFSDRFLGLGLKTFRQAARYVHQLPYGPNRIPAEDDALFRDGRGTCATKHGALALLARELELPVHRWYGLYRLNEEIVAGTGAILQMYGIPFVPAGHCFLIYSNEMVDLTAGNKHGKKKEPGEFLVKWPDPPWQQSQNQARTEAFVTMLLSGNPFFSHLSIEELDAIHARCLVCMRKNRIGHSPE